ncbi:MAG: ABC transporter permease [Bacteroidales bacterium]|nr:ABC transporter permease [Bacteroidales bacterium]
MIWSIAWKNIWRNKKRSLVVIIAVTLGIIAGVFLIGFIEGWSRQRLHDAIYNEVSHIQIHNNEYLKNEETHLTIKHPDKIFPYIDTLKEVKSWVRRTKIIAMANTPWANTGLVLNGIDAERERLVTEIYNEIVKKGGRYIDGDNPADILISDKTSELLRLKHFVVTDSIIEELRQEKVPESVLEKLDPLKDIRYRSPKDFNENLMKVLTGKESDNFGFLIYDKALDYRIRSRVQVTISDKDGNPIQGIFRVCGIYKTTNTGFDQSAAFVNASELARLYGSDEILTHEVAVILGNIDDADMVREKLIAVSGDNSVRTWKELAPDAALMNDFMLVYYLVFIGIIMLALAFGIINTMLMAVLERTKELGMLMAIGMNRKRVFSMIMLETVFLTVVGAAAGIISGWALTGALGKTGIHLSGWKEGFEAIGFAATVYPIVTPGFIVLTAIMVIFTAIVSSLWPARKALKLIPVEALRTE